MRLKTILAAVAALGVTALNAFAQNSLVEVDDNVQVTAFSATVDEIDDLDVYNAAGTKIGEVEDMVGTDKSTPTALIIDFEGTEGYADQDVVVPIDQVVWENDRLILSADTDTVNAMEVWKD